MDLLAKNLSHLAAMEGLKQQDIGEAVGISQSNISRILAGRVGEPGWRTIQKIARRFGVSMDDLVNVDLSVRTRPASSQAEGIDADKLGTALTSIDKALSDMSIQGKLGTLARTIIYAYGVQERHYPHGVPAESRGVYDELIAGHLERFLGEQQRRVVGEDEAGGAGGDIKTPAKGSQDRRR